MRSKIHKRTRNSCLPFYLPPRGNGFWLTVFCLVLVNCILLVYHATLLRDSQRFTSAIIQKVEKTAFLLANHDSQLPRQSAVTPETSKAGGLRLAAHVRRQCNKLNRPYHEDEGYTPFLIGRMHFLSSADTLYCPVEKVGTTYWRRVLYQVVNTRYTFSNPYDVPISDALSYPFERLENKSSIDNGAYFKFMFVRNPYHRILSAYIDKIFVPNPLFWERFGGPSITMFRKGGKPSKPNCFHDATFAEFVNFVVWSERSKNMIDPHFLMASDMCIPCAANYTFVGKMESFNADSAYIHNQLNFTMETSASQLKELAERDAIRDSIVSPFSWKEQISQVNCMSWHEALLRIWRKLQMRGLVDMDQRYPLNRRQSERVTQRQFILLANKARNMSDPSKMKRQKKLVFMELYRTVSMATLHALRQVFLSDFQLFNYTVSPDDIFNRTLPFKPRNFTDFTH